MDEDQKNDATGMGQKTFATQNNPTRHLTIVFEGRRDTYEYKVGPKTSAAGQNSTEYHETVNDERTKLVGKKYYVCHVCQKSFSARKNMMKPKRTVHDGRRDYECNVCHTAFTRKDHLIRHLVAVHEGRRDYECDVCKKTFTSKQSLKLHLGVVHEGRKDYECDVCQKTFTQRNNMKQHKESFHGATDRV